MNQIAPGFDEWCVVELMGHRRLVGRVREATFPAGFLRIDEPDQIGDLDGSTWIPGRTQIVNPTSLYAMHPVTQDVAISLAEQWRSEPITKWDLPQDWRTPAAIAAPSDDDYRDDEGPF